MSGVQIDVDVRSSKADRDLEGINQSLRNIEKTTNTTSAALTNMFKGLALTAASAVSLNSIRNISSEFTELSNKIATVTGRTKELAGAQDRLFKIAEETRGSLQSTVTTFSSFGRALKQTGASTERILNATKAVQEAMALSGSSAESANAAITQLGQGLSSGVLRGEELNSVLEQGSRLGKAIADEMGVTTGQLRLMAADGKLTSGVVFNAILRQSQAINKEFKDLAPTLSQGTSQLNDAVKIYVNELDKGLGVSAALGLSTFSMSKSIRQAAENAFDLGAQINLVYNRVSKNVTSIAAPIGNIAIALGKQFAKVLPQGFLSRTLSGDVNDALRTFDDATGNWIQKYKQFKLINLVSWDSDIEIAIKKLKRLSPAYWAGAGFDVPTLKRFFSTKNIMAYGQAFQELAVAIAGNGNSITDTLAEFASDTRASTLASLRYFGFLQDTLINIRPGQFQTIFKSLSEIIRGFSGASIKIYEFGKIIQTFTDDYIIVFGVAVKDAFVKSLSFIGAFAKGAVKAVSWAFGAIINLLDELKPVSSAIDEFLAADEYDMMAEAVVDSLHKMTNAIESVPAKLNKAYQSIKDFSKKVIHEFFVIYDDVIAHSWWTDTIESVVDTSNNLWDRVSSGLHKFASNTINLFKRVFDRSNSLSLDWSNIKSVDFSFTSLKLPKIDTGSLSEAFITTIDSLKKNVTAFFDAFPSIAKATLVGLGGVIIALMFPAGAIKTALLTAVLTSLVTSGTLIAEQFGSALTGGSFVSELGYNIGKAAGYFTATIIQELPKLINAITGVASAFTRGFLEELPLIGTAFKAIFTAADGAGVGGPLGLLGTIVFGAGIARLLMSLDIAKKPIEGIFDMFKSISTVVFGGAGGKRDGVLSTYFFGTLGPTRALSLIGVALQYFGAFDSLFAHSELLSYATSGGLMYLALAGDQGLNKITDIIGSKVVKPVADAVKSMGKNVLSGNKTLYDIFFGDTGTWAERASAGLKSVMDKISGAIVDAAAPYVSKGYDFVKTLLLGTNSSATVSALKTQMTAIYVVMVEQVGKIRAAIGTLNLGSMFSGMSAGPGLKDYEALIGKTFGTASAQMSKVAGMAERIGGSNGLLGKLFLGKYGKWAILGTILAVFSSVTMAAETAATAQKSVFDDVFSNWNTLKLENPIAAVALQITAVTIPLMLGALWVFRTQAMTALSGVFDIGKISSWSSAFISDIGKIAKNMKTIGLVGGAAAVGGLVGNKMGGGEMAIMGAMLAAELAITFRKALLGLLARVGSIFAGVLTSWVTWVVAGVAALGGALYLWFFGKKGEFWSDIDKAFSKVKEFFGLKPDTKAVSTGLSTDADAFAKAKDLGVTYNLSDINKKNLSDKENTKLNGLVAELEKTIQQSIDEQELTGRISTDTRDQIATLNRQLGRYSDKLVNKSNPEAENFGKFLEDLKNKTSDTRAGDIKLSLDQSQLDIAYFVNQALLKAGQMLATTQPAKLAATSRLDALKASKDTRYNARYRGPNAGEDQLRNLEKTYKGLENPSDILDAQIKKLKIQYIQSAKDLVSAESEIRFSFSQMGFVFNDLPDSDPVKKKKLALEQELSTAMQQAVDYSNAKTAIDKFQNDVNRLQANLTAVGVTFESNALFASSDAAFEQLKKLGDEAKYLAEQLKNTKTVAEQNAIIVRINEIKTQTTIIKADADTQSLERTQFKLKELAGRVNSNVFSDETFKKLGDQAADAYYKEYTKIFQEIERLKVRTAGDTGAQKFLDASTKVSNLSTQQVSVQKQIDSLMPSEIESKKELTRRKDEIFKAYTAAVEEFEKLKIQQTINPTLGTAEAGVNFLKEYKRIEDDRKALEDRIRKDLSGGPGNIAAQRDVASSVGVDFNKIVSMKGVNTAIAGIDKLKAKKEALEKAENANDITAVGKLTRDIDNLTESLNKAPTTLQTFISTLSGLGSAIGVDELAIVSPKTLQRLRAAVMSTIALDEQIQKLGPNVAQSKFEEIVSKKLTAAKAAFDAYIETIYSTPDKIMQGLSRIGLTDNFEISLLPDGVINDFLKIDTIVLKLQNQLKDPANVSRFKEIVAQLTEAQKRSKTLKDTFASFNTRLDVVNKAFSMNLSAEEFANLPSEIQIELSDKANKFMTTLDDFMKSPFGVSTSASSNSSSSPLNVVVDSKVKTSGSLDVSANPLANADSIIAGIRKGQLELRAASLNASSSLEVFNARLKVEKDKIPSIPLSDIANSIVQTFPVLSDFQDIINKLSREELRELAGVVADVNDAKRKYDAGLSSPAELKSATQAGSAKVSAKINTMVYGTDTRSLAKVAGIDIEQASMNMIDANEKKLIEGILAGITAAKKDVESATSDSQRIAAQSIVNAKMDQLDEAIRAATQDVGAKARDAGKAFASSVSEGINSSLLAFVKGEKTFKETAKDILDNFSNSVLTTFMQGLLDPFTGENGIVTNMMKDLGKSIFGSANKDSPTKLLGDGASKWVSDAFSSVKSFFGFGGGETTAATGVVGAATGATGIGGCNSGEMFKGVGDKITTAITEGTDAMSGFFSGLGSIFEGGLSALGSSLGEVWNSLSSSLGSLFSGGGGGTDWGSLFSSVAGFFATGGMVTGPGSGKSDSIPAMISNGEFIVNAKATKQFLPLLHGINGGKLPKFADGGLVSATMMATPVAATIQAAPSAQAQPVQQVFQINVTGDVSRQTRAEIQRMLPNIATGVNSYNREKR